MGKPSSQTKARILDSARKVFAQCGYAAASVQDIVSMAKVTKPALYYYFGSKAGLYQALLNQAADERFDLMKQAVAGAGKFEDRLTALVDVLLKHARDQRDLMRIVFSSWFAAPGEVPERLDASKGLRNYEFMNRLIQDGVRAGVIDPRHKGQEAVSAFISQVFFNSMVQIGRQRKKFRPIPARTIVKMYLEGVRPGGSRR